MITGIDYRPNAHDHIFLQIETCSVYSNNKSLYVKLW